MGNEGSSSERRPKLRMSLPHPPSLSSLPPSSTHAGVEARGASDGGVDPVAAGAAWGDVLDRAALQHTDAVAAVGIEWDAGGGTFLRGWVGGWVGH